MKERKRGAPGSHKEKPVQMLTNQKNVFKLVKRGGGNRLARRFGKKGGKRKQSHIKGGQ